MCTPTFTTGNRERRLLWKKQLNPETLKALQDAGVEIPEESLQEAKESLAAKDTVENEAKATNKKVKHVAGTEIQQQKPVDVRPEQPKTNPSTFRHLESARKAVPSVGEVGKTAITAGTVLVPPAALAVAAGIGVRNLWQRIRGVPKEQRVGLSGSVKEGLRSTGRTLLAPFKAGFNVARFGLENAGRLVAAPVKKLNSLLTYTSNESGSKAKHFLIEGVKLPFKLVGGTLKLGRDLILKIPGILKSVVNDFDKHPIFSAIGLTIAAGGIIAVSTQPAALGAATVAIVQAGAKFISFLPDALKALLKLKSYLPK